MKNIIVSLLFATSLVISACGPSDPDPDPQMTLCDPMCEKFCSSSCTGDYSCLKHCKDECGCN